MNPFTIIYQYIYLSWTTGLGPTSLGFLVRLGSTVSMRRGPGLAEIPERFALK
jgi:hypothetical protein